MAAIVAAIVAANSSKINHIFADVCFLGNANTGCNLFGG